MGLKRAAALPRRIAGRLLRESRGLLEQLRNTFVPTYPSVAVPVQGMERRFLFLDRACLDRIQTLSPSHSDLILRQAEDALAHRFDLLGSGPVVVAHGLACAGLEGHSFAPAPSVCPDVAGNWLAGRINRSNLSEARRIWSRVDDDYQPIDWQLDYKSGYRWREQSWFRSIRFGHLPGMDIKLPWELARMQHLPVLALAAHYAGSGLCGFRPAVEYGREVRNQILDFIATNPPGFGVNWSCAMEVGIRLANMLVAWDLLQAAGQEFQPDVEAIFTASVRSHGRHVVANLEWAPRFRGNHYLANIVGLLFAAVYLPRDAETDLWLNFATEELLAEINYQFHEDGSNFEASICYHRLSAEIVLWGLSLLDNLATEKCEALSLSCSWPGRVPHRRQVGPVTLFAVPGSTRLSPVPVGCRQRVAGMAAFTRAMTRPDGLVVQFGDNDSGRFITLGSSEQIRAAGDPAHPAWSLDHGAFLAGADAFLGGEATDVGALLLAGLAGRASLPGLFPVPPSAGPVGEESCLTELRRLWDGCASGSRWRCDFPGPLGFLSGLDAFHFPGMGCYVLRGPRFYLVVRCGEIGLAGLGAHAHCDQLAIELVIDGKDQVRDPGSYLYTALPDRRNEYRSVRAHHAPRCLDREPADLHQGEFDLRGASEGECLYFGPDGFAGRHAGYGDWVYRIVSLEDDKVVVLDFSQGGLLLRDPNPLPLPFSQGYGRLIFRA